MSSLSSTSSAASSSSSSASSSASASAPLHPSDQPTPMLTVGQKPFDLVIGWDAMSLAECVATHLLSNAPMLAMEPHGQVFQQAQLDACRDKRVLICGDNFPPGELNRIGAVATSVEVWLYARDAGIAIARLTQELTQTDQRPKTAVKVSTFDLNKFDGYPRATRLLRRALEPEHEEYAVDNAFWRGLMAHALSHDLTQIEVVHAWLDGTATNANGESYFIMTGGSGRKPTNTTITAVTPTTMTRAPVVRNPIAGNLRREELLRLGYIKLAQMQAAAPKPFDLVIGWGPLVEETVAAFLLSGARPLNMKPHGKVFQQEQLDLCAGKRVLVCGSYFSGAELRRLAAVTKSLDVWAYSRESHAKLQLEMVCIEDVASGDAAAPLPPRELTIRGSIPRIDRFTLDKFAAFPGATRLLRRALSPVHAAHGKDDEAFYRGMIHDAFTRAIPHDDAIRDWLRVAFTETICGDEDEQAFIDTGRIVVAEHQRIAKDAASSGGMLVKCGEVWLCVVPWGHTLVMPVGHEAAARADIGVVVRFAYESKRTLLTFVTANQTDLTFVTREPFNGDGNDTCKGTTLMSLIPIEDILAMIATAKTRD